MMAVFVFGNVLCALASSYWLLMGARIVIACSHGLFFGVALVIATGLVPKDRQATAVSLVSGITVANVLGVPAGTAIGNAFGWRGVLGDRGHRCRRDRRSRRLAAARGATGRRRSRRRRGDCAPSAARRCCSPI